MQKSKLIFIGILSILILGLVSCLDTKDENKYLEWRDSQDKIYDKIVTYKNPEDGKISYYGIASESGGGNIYARSSDFITKRMEGDFDIEEPVAFPGQEEDEDNNKIYRTQTRPIYITDSVVVRYQGWFLTEEEKPIIFDTTENTNNVGSAGFGVGSVVDGFRTGLMSMNVGEELIICIPNNLGYGMAQSGGIPPYTTLFFDVKLLEIYTGEGELVASMFEPEIDETD